MRVLGDVPGRAAFPVRGSTEGAGRSRKPNADTLKRVFSLFPSGVVIATVVDRQGEPHGFTASTFVPLSLDPPMILVCLNRSAQCYEAFVTGASFAVSVLRPEHEEIALRFATRGADKFSADHIDRTAGGLPVVRGHWRRSNAGWRGAIPAATMSS